MPLIDIRCLTCGTISEVQRPLAMWPEVPPCPSCASPTEQVHLPSSTRSSTPPVVVYRMPDGSFRFPGHPDSPSTRKYAAEGGTRLELRGWQEVRPFERHMNEIERAKIVRRFERQSRARDEGERLRRADLRHRMQSMTAGGQAFARTLLHSLDRKPKPQPYEPGFHVEAYSFDRSNREESRDERGRRRND